MSEELINDYIRRRIKIRREELNMSQEDLAKAVGYKDKTAISKIERGAVKIDVNLLQKIAAAMYVTPQYFFPKDEIVPTENDAFRDYMKENYGVLFDLVEKADDKQRRQIESIVKTIVGEDDPTDFGA